MANRIVDVQVQTHRLMPTEAELWVIVTAEQMTPTTEVRGKFVGPRCALSSTIEVAYPLRPFSSNQAQLPELSMRVVIPEPNVWEAQCPFVYDGTIELWEDGACCNVHQVRGYRLLTTTR